MAAWTGPATGPRAENHGGPRPWPWFAGVKARAALAATLIVAVALVLGATAFIVLLQRALTESIDAVAVDRTREVTAGFRSVGDLTGSELAAALATVVRRVSRPGTVIQVLDVNGVVVAQSPDLEGEPPLAGPLSAGAGVVHEDRALTAADGATYRMVRSAIDSPTGGYTIIAAQSLESVAESTAAAIPLLGFGLPLLLLVVGGSTFLLVGRSLRPVEAIREKVASIGDRELTERVPVPRARDEIARLAATMNEMLDRLEAAQVSQRRFVADASHELRSPIATLKAAAEVALAHPDGADDAAMAETFADETIRLERLVNDLLLLAHADERGLSPERREVDLDDLLLAERERVRSTTGLAVTARIDAVRVWGSSHQLAQALRNLVDNAMRHAAARIALTLVAEDGHAIIRIADDGPGIPPEDRERVFDRFVRLDESRERALGGTGLGLAIVREIVRAHGGSVAVVDSEAGAALEVVLPVSPTGQQRTPPSGVDRKAHQPRSASR